MPNPFEIHAPYEPKGDQPEAIKSLVAGVESGERYQTLLGSTGTGQTFTIANVIAQTGRPALVLAHKPWRPSFAMAPEFAEERR